MLDAFSLSISGLILKNFFDEQNQLTNTGLLYYFFILVLLISFLGGYSYKKMLNSIKTFNIILIANISMPFLYTLIIVSVGIRPINPESLINIIVVSALILLLFRLLVILFKNSIKFLKKDTLIIGDGAHFDEFINTDVTYINLIDEGKNRINEDDPDFLDYLSNLCKRYDRILIDFKKRKVSDLIAKIVNTSTNEIEQIRDSKRLQIKSTSSIKNFQTFVYSNLGMKDIDIAKKRVFDLLIIILSLPIWLPLIIFCSFIIKVTSKGPIFFHQRRIGFNNKFFKIIKFRSMYLEDSDKDALKLTKENDPRVTIFGRFLRKSSLDELPQIINVLLGDMSLVGPRPHATGAKAGNKLYWEATSNYWHRHKVLPGITGLAQLRGFRGNTFNEQDIQKRLRADLEYLNNWSLLKDIRILTLTFFTLFSKNSF
tara:strand:+ start:149 stop:1432 length:1284 start_codon:yes stop_codon:yes gene_type:complete